MALRDVAFAPVFAAQTHSRPRRAQPKKHVALGLRTRTRPARRLEATAAPPRKDRPGPSQPSRPPPPPRTPSPVPPAPPATPQPVAKNPPGQTNPGGPDATSEETVRKTKKIYVDGLSYPPDMLEWCSTEDDGEGRCVAVIGEPGVDAVKVDGELCSVEETRRKCGVLFSQRVDKAFVETFRQSSPYINAHSGMVFVIHLPGELVQEKNFGSLMEDIALMRIVGIKLVLVLGPRIQIERRLAGEGVESKWINNTRVTDEAVLRVVMEASGSMMYEVESLLSRGVVNMPSSSRISVVTSNFYTAKPVGVIDGDDFGYTGAVRKFDVDAMTSRLDDGDILVLRNVGASPSGQLFNCQSEEVAGACAAALCAEKLIFMGSGESLYDKRIDKPIPNLTLTSANDFLLRRSSDLPEHFRRYLQVSVKALNKGVTRAHLLNRAVDGVLLMEVFHRDGVGLMISRDLYEGIRFAALSDVLGIEAIIKPLENQGVLVKRGRARIEQAIESFVVVERDGMVIACLSLEVMGDNSEWAELGCLAVHPDYRKLGKADAMLGFTERYAYTMGIRNLFILSTVTFQWFVERGFKDIPVDSLPQSRQAKYDHKRASKIYHKVLEGSRAVDEAEILKHL